MKLLSIFIGVLSLLGIGLFKPIASSKWKITYNQAMIESSQNFLLENHALSPLKNKPNIVVIMADDLGKTDISLYGNTLINTPHIDAIGHHGVVFNQGYISSPICAPSRAGFLTGRYQQRFGFEIITHERYPKNYFEYLGFKYLKQTGNWRVHTDYDRPQAEDVLLQGLPPQEITLAQLLKLRQYKTACMGKWHLGSNSQNIPLAKGFDTHYGFYEAFTLYGDPKSEEIVNQRHPFDFSDPYIWKKGRQGNCAIRKNGQVVEDQMYLTDRIAQQSVNFIHENKDHPFFLYVPFLAPHTPFQATKKHYDALSHIQDENKRVYCAMVASLDEAVGSIMQALKDNGLEENTLVVFMSDNGGATYTRATDNSPLKGGKFSHFEGGINVPFMVQYKGKIPEGQQFNESVISFDVFATIVEMLSIPLPADRVYDGVNLMPFLSQQKKGPVHKALMWRCGENSAIRMGNWKMIQDHFSGNKVLYQMTQNNHEKHNVMVQYPEKLKELEAYLQHWEKDLMDPLWPRVMNYRFVTDEGDFYFPL